MLKIPRKERRKRRSSLFPRLKFHPLFLSLGIWYALTGELFLFLLSALVALQHECAHAFAAAKLGYKLNAVVLMPYGAVIDGDLKSISLKDEIFVAICGPLCNLATAIFFMALWWFAPSTYPFTDLAFYSSLSIALINLLPCYPLDGGRILRCILTNAFLKTQPEQVKAEKRAEKLCRVLTFAFALFFLGGFVLQTAKGAPNITLLAFGFFLLVGGFGNREKTAVYERLDLSFSPTLKRGVEIRRIAVDGDCPVKDVLRFVARGIYLVLEIYEEGKRVLELPQNRLAELFLQAKTPYEPILSLARRQNLEKREERGNFFL